MDFEKNMHKLTDALSTGLKHFFGAATFGAYHYYVIRREHDIILESMRTEREIARLEREKDHLEMEKKFRRWF